MHFTGIADHDVFGGDWTLEHAGVCDPGVGILVFGIEDGKGLCADEVVVCIHEDDDIVGVTVFADPEIEVSEGTHLHQWMHKLDLVFEGVVGVPQVFKQSFKFPFW
jgi:hypothetical protein